MNLYHPPSIWHFGMAMAPPLLLLVGGLVAVFVIPALIRWIWNMTCPEIFHLPAITHWQAFRLMLLVGFLFGSARLL